MLSSVLDLIGNTPLVPLPRMNPNPGVQLLAKIESHNPGGSIKDRVALAMVEAAEKGGHLTPDKIVIEATSGNTGIGLAMVCAVKGYRLKLLMPETASQERRRIMVAYGAEIELTPGHLSTDGAIEEAYRLAREEAETYVLMDQFNNPASISAHYRGTAREVWEQTEGRVTHAVATLGTSGTAMGLAARLKEEDSGVQVVAVEPHVGHKIQGLKNMQASYPPGIYNKHVLDRILRVDDEEAFALCRELARQEGIFVGMSSGAALGGAMQLVRSLDSGTVVVIFPDGGERYLSTSLFVPPAEQGISVYNLKTRELDRLDLSSKSLSVFAPGPPPDAPADAGAWRRLLFLDLLARYIQSKEVAVQAVAGVADMDDQALAQAAAKGQTPAVYSAEFVQSLEKRAQVLGFTAVRFSPASGQVNDMLDMCRTLLGKGRAYEKLRSVYYDVFRDREYGSLVQTDLSKLSVGKTVDLDDYAKDNPRDFTLLKRASLHNLKKGDFLKTEWGNVRPSWYLQMAAAPAGASADLQVVLAGRPHRFPHLDNLRAVWTKTGRAVPDIWALVQAAVPGEHDPLPADIDSLLELMPHPLALRMWLLSIDYRKPLVLTREGCKMWAHNWRRVQNMVAGVSLRTSDGEQGEMGKAVKQALFDLRQGWTEDLEKDLAVYTFWPVLFTFCRQVNAWLKNDGINPAEARAVLETIRRLDAVLGIVNWPGLPLPAHDWPQEVAALLEKRRQAQAAKDFARADDLRNETNAMGYRVEDTPQGPRVYRRQTTEDRRQKDR
ncbi:MAG: cysteine synthase [Desulfovermiculus sp.]|nr:cysteine synthase [Desulfovermiculus sp.]